MSLVQHEIRCRYNPDRIDISKALAGVYKYNHSDRHINTNKYIKAKQLGLPKPEVSEETRRKISTSTKGKKVVSEETKQKISKYRKDILSKNPYASSWLMNHSSKPSYGERYFIELFEKENIPLKYHKWVGRYQLDFYNEELKKYIEVDGEQHYSEKGIKHDIERTEYLKDKGWTGYRIRWSIYKAKTYEEKQLVINNIVKFLNG